MKATHHPAAIALLFGLAFLPGNGLFVSPLLTARTVKSRAREHCLWMQGGTNDDTSSNEKDAFILEKEYELTEQLVAERGEIEELLMRASVSRPLLANEPSAPTAGVSGVATKGFGGGSGGGGSTKKKKKKKSNKDSLKGNRKLEDAKDHAKVLKEQGLVRIDGILSDSVTDSLRDFVYGIRTTEQLKAASMQATFSTIRRWDLSIPLFEYTDNEVATRTTTIAHRALQDVLQKSVVGETMRRFLGTADAELYELSSYISDPQSTRQVIHADTPCFGTDDSQPILCTCFIALQDVRMDMGPTVWLPKTNTYAMHDLFFHEEEEASETTITPVKDRFLQTHDSVVGVIPKGSCVLFDSRLLHCGTANKSNSSRALLFFSFQHPDINLYNPGGDTASIRADLKGKFRLSDFL